MSLASLRGSIMSFVAGAAVTGPVVYYKLHQDLYTTSELLNQTILAEGARVSAANSALAARVAALEEAAGGGGGSGS